MPLIFVDRAARRQQRRRPDGLPFGDYVRETGLAIPLVCLAFGAFWLFPLITALVAGDIVATEDSNGTLKTILTRSVERWQVFAGKVLAALTYAAARAAAVRRRRAGGGRPDLGLRPADDAVSSSVRFADARGRMKRSDDSGVARDADLFALVPVSLF